MKKLRGEVGAITGCVGRGCPYLSKNQHFTPFSRKNAQRRESVNFSPKYAAFNRFLPLFCQHNALIFSVFEKNIWPVKKKAVSLLQIKMIKK